MRLRTRSYLCDPHLAAGAEVLARRVRVYDPLTGRRSTAHLCAGHLAAVRESIASYRRFLRRYGHAPDAELECDAEGCDFEAVNPQGRSRHITARHPELVETCPTCQTPTANMKQHRWRYHW